MKKLLIFLCLLLWICSTVLTVSADSPDEGTVNSAALNYFTGVVNKLPTNCNYVIYRSGDYSAAMVYGFELELNNNTFSSPSCTRLIYDTRGTGSTGYYSPTVSENSIVNFNLTTSNNHILYSSLGSYSSVGDTNKDTFTYILWSIVLLILLFVAFKFFRNRRHYLTI